MKTQERGISEVSPIKISACSQLRRRLELLGLVAAACLLLGTVGAAPAFADFGIANFDGTVTDENGNAFTQAGGHPFEATTNIDWATDPNTGLATESPKDVMVDLPAGFIGNPNAVPKCTRDDFEDINLGGGCPIDTQIGTSTLKTGPFGSLTFPVFNMTPKPGQPARFVFRALIPPVFIDASVRTGGDYGLTTTISDISQALPLTGTTLTLWGVPADPAHDAERGGPSDAPLKPFLTLPTSCRGPLVTTLHTDSWQDPGDFKTASFLSHDPNNPELTGGPTGCNHLSFDPTLDVQPDTSAADSPTGLDVDLGIPQAPDDPSGLVTSHLEKTVVHLPEGLTLNPAAADGLAGCSPAQVALGSADEPSCPDASKIGTMEIDTPLLDNPMLGSIYLAQQGNNPFGSLLAIYLVAEEQGVLVKLPGRIDADPNTGQLTATFDDTPQLPFSDFKLHFNGGPRAVLATPPECGTYETTSEVSPWSGPPSVPNSGPPDTPSDSFQITTGPGGGACPSSSFAPSFHAGTQNPTAGAASPFVVRLSRADGTEQLGSLDVDLPPGMLAKLAGIPHCSNAEAQLAALGAGGCPAGSRVGGVEIGSGVGSNPFYLPGDVYLTEGYKGAPFGLAIVVHALAGPFDLGTIVVRAALFIDPDDAQIHVVSDPFPDILKGIPLRLRDIQVVLDRPGFTLNPTNCQPMAVTGTVHGLEGGLAAVSDHFQLTGCGGLGFSPSLTGAILNGAQGIHRSDHPNLQFNLHPNPGDANLSRLEVLLPQSFQIDQANLGNLCSETELATNECAGRNTVGTASATTPLLGSALAGPVYAVSGSGGLPSLALILNGPAAEPVHLLVRGITETVGARIKNTFPLVPDAPITDFTLTLNGGPAGYLVNNTEVCGKAKGKSKKAKKKAKKLSRTNLTANAFFVAQNADTRSQKVSIAAKCKKGKKGKKKK